MKKAFTTIELIFVIILIGIISAIAITSLKSNDNSLELATHETLSAIRYTQHLAISQHKFDPKDNAYTARGGAAANKGKYFLENWQISFANNTYQIWSDANRNGKLDKGETAKNPTDNNDYIVNLSDKYDITSIIFSGGCAGANLIAFDRIGRPLATLGTSNGYEGNIQSECDIKITNPNGSETIAIEPETGYAKIK